MTGKAVAVIGEVTPIPAKDDAGTWVPDPITYEVYDHLTIRGLSVIYSASCTFRFISNTTTKPEDTVTLSAGASVLQGGQTHVLVNDDSAPGTVAKNELRVSTSNKLRSA